MLQYAINQIPNTTAFTFKATGIRVYSLEEAMYHVFHYWRESVDDFLCPGIIAWVAESLGLSRLAAKMTDIVNSGADFTRRILDFLQIAQYFSTEDIAAITTTLETWEKRQEWEKLKERADFLAREGQPEKALPLYKKALVLEENPATLNNIGVILMTLAKPKEAVRYLQRGRILDATNLDLTLHYAEAAILSHQFEAAGKAIDKIIATDPTLADIPYLQGLMYWHQRNYVKAIAHYTQAIAISPLPHYSHQLAQVYKAMRRFDKAIEVLAPIKPKTADTLVVEADIHVASGDISAALRCMRQATTFASGDAGKKDPLLWARLAEYYRRDYDWHQAQAAIETALAMAPHNDKVRLEAARIKKGLGNNREYQKDLGEILGSFRDRYREDYR